MAKRLGNVTTVQGMRESRISAAAVRHFVFNTHYRKELNLSEEALEASINAVRRVGDFAERLATAMGGTPALGEAADAAVAEVEAALFDDLNAPNALGGLFTFITKANAELDRKGSDAESLDRARAAFAENQRRAGHRSRSDGGRSGARGVGGGAIVGASCGARAAGFCGGGPDSQRADGAGHFDRGRPERDKVEASAIAG